MSTTSILMILISCLIAAAQIGNLRGHPVGPLVEVFPTEDYSIYNEVKTHYCEKFTVWLSLPGTTITADHDRCYCVEQCVSDRLTDMLRPAKSSEEYIKHNYQLFNCVEQCFNGPSTSSVARSQHLKLTLTREGGQPITEQELLDSLETLISLFRYQLAEPYKRLYLQLNATYQMGKANHSSFLSENGSKYITDNSIELTDTCFPQIVKENKAEENLEQVLEQTIHCRLFMRCFINLLKAMNAKDSAEQCTGPDQWRHYTCARSVFVSSQQAAATTQQPAAVEETTTEDDSDYWQK